MSKMAAKRRQPEPCTIAMQFFSIGLRCESVAITVQFYDDQEACSDSEPRRISGEIVDEVMA